MLTVRSNALIQHLAGATGVGEAEPKNEHRSESRVFAPVKIRELWTCAGARRHAAKGWGL